MNGINCIRFPYIYNHTKLIQKILFLSSNVQFFKYFLLTSLTAMDITQCGKQF